MTNLIITIRSLSRHIWYAFLSYNNQTYSQGWSQKKRKFLYSFKNKLNSKLGELKNQNTKMRETGRGEIYKIYVT